MNMFCTLYVGNNLVRLQELRRKLANFGLEVMLALHGSDAERHFERHKTNLGSIVIEDDGRTGTGPAFAALVREKGFKGRIIITSRCRERASRTYASYRVHDICSMPIDICVLVTMLLQAE